MGTNNLAKAQGALRQLLGMMEFKRVVCIDDDYTKNISVTTVIAFCRELVTKNMDALKAIEEFNSIPFSESEEIWKDILIDVWNDIEDVQRRDAIYNTLRAAVNDPGTEDPAYSLILDELLLPLEDLLEFRRLPMREWRLQKNELLNQIDDVKTLFLFDQDFSKEGESPTAGLDLIAEVLAYKGRQPVICALLSHTHDPDGEQSKRDKIAEERGLDRDRLVLISKFRLRKDPLGFARMVKLTAINEPCMALKRKTWEAIDKAQQSAREQVDKIDIYDFEHIVFQSSYQEGVWEPDTLFRIFGLYQRKEAREKAKEDPDIERIAASIRPYSNIPTDSEEAPPHSSWKIHRLEIYEDVNYLNKRHTPVDLGDIFETSGKRQFILLAPPCDLMVRPEDEMKNKGVRHPTVTEATLVEICNYNLGKEPQNKEAYHHLSYFDEKERKSYYIYFRSRCAIKLSILDLCAYQDDGIAKFKATDSCPADVILPWKYRFEHLKEEMTAIIDKYAQLETDDLGSEILEKFIPIPAPAKEKLFKGKINSKERSIEFKCKRVGRLTLLRAGAVLTNFNNYLARAAFEHDFGRDTIHNKKN